jgi:hypothetical protein
MRRDLIAARRPTDALELALVEDIALLYWKKQHLESAEVAVQAVNLRKYDLERKKLSIQVLRGGDSNTSEYLACRNGLRNNLESPGQFEEVINRLWRVVTMTETDDFSIGMKTHLLVVYGNDPTLRGGNIDTHYQLLKDMKPDHPKYEALKQELVRSLMNEIADLVKEYQLYLDEYVQTTRAARVASMTPTEGQWPVIIRQQNALDRLLERKIRLLMEVQKNRIVYGAPAPSSHPASTPPGGADPPRDPASRYDPALSPGERVGPDGAFTSRRGSGEGSLASCPSPTQKAENSGNELHDLLQTQGLTNNDPSKRTGPSAPNEPPGEANRCSAGVPPAVAGASRPRHSARAGCPRHSGQDARATNPHPSEQTENSGNELNDLLQARDLAHKVYTKRTVSEV